MAYLGDLSWRLRDDRELRGQADRALGGSEHVREFSGFARKAELRLDRLEAASSLPDLAALPGNRLELLKGDRAGQYSIRINDQWRICFNWPAASRGPTNVEIVDYH
jgi:proteic killer suppression protein